MLTVFIKSWGKRVDVVAEKDNEVWIIEVATRAFLRAIGQCTVYGELWKINPPIKKPFKSYIVCTTIDPDVAYTCERLGINYLTI